MSDANELVPLRPGFDTVLRGYRRGQVKQYVQGVEQELALTAADRDANAAIVGDLTRQVEQLRAENATLHRRLNQLCATPMDAAAVPLRLRRTVELAKQEAAEITARAQAAAESCWAGAEEAAERLRGQYTSLLAELDTRRAEMEAEHRSLMRQTQVEVTAMTTAAERRSEELDQLAEQRRADIESDFEVAMATRRTEAMQEIAERRETARVSAEATLAEACGDAQRRLLQARTEAEQLVTDATAEAAELAESSNAEAKATALAAAEEAERHRREARQEVDDLRQLRDRIASQLDTARDALTAVNPLMRPVPEERRLESVPQQRDHSPARAKAAS